MKKSASAAPGCRSSPFSPSHSSARIAKHRARRLPAGSGQAIRALSDHTASPARARLCAARWERAMTPEVKKHYDDTHRLMAQVGPLFDGVHSFTMMMVLSDLIAQWITSHDPTDSPRLAEML